MNPQTFHGSTLAEARSRALQTLGESAVIVATREVRKDPPLGWFEKPTFEVQAIAKVAEAIRSPFAASTYQSAARSDEDGGEVGSLRTELRREVRALRAAMAKPTAAPPELLDEISALREALAEMPSAKKGKNDKAAAVLSNLAIEGHAAVLLGRVLRNAEDPRAVIDEALTQMLPVTPWPIEGKGRQLIALVGPTGVGKTTTAAKLAAHALASRRSVTFIGCDGYRVGAVDQLRRFAEALRVKTIIAGSRASLEKALAQVTTDIVIIDTAGQGPGAPEGPEAALRAHARESVVLGYARHVVLCANASLRARDADRVARVFGPLGITEVAMTKLDETDQPSGILHTVAATRAPVAISCFGQRVPEDIASANAAALVGQITRPLRPRGSRRSSS
jgi:flagellar biosynthesis protein FlhF